MLQGNPYDAIFSQPEMLLWNLAALLVLLTWLFLSLRYTFRWYVSFREGMTRWSGSIPDKKATNELALMALTWSANLALLGGFLYVVV